MSPKMELVAANDAALAPTTMPVPTTADPVLHMIERILRDPSIPMERLDKMLDVQERVMRQRSQEAFNIAFSQMQPKLPIIAQRGEHGGTGRTYARWDDVIEAIMPVLGEFGFSLRSRSRQAEGKIYVTSVLAHLAGHSEETTIELPADQTGQKNPVQAIGSSFSYGQRYGAKLLLSLSSRETGTPPDDDGAAAGDEYISKDQLAKLIKLADEVGVDKQKICETCGIDGLALMPIAKFAKVMHKLNLNKKAKA